VKILLIGTGLGSVGMLAAAFVAYANRCTRPRRGGMMDMTGRKL
jgi:hypothetical protein